jgi:hypothetical protein
VLRVLTLPKARSLDPQTWLSVLPEGEDFWVRHVQEPWALGLIAPVYEPKGLETSEMGKAITCPSCEASIFGECDAHWWWLR